MIEIILNSGTTWDVPLDWNNGNNSIEVWGGGARSHAASGPKSSGPWGGGGAGSYARGDNIALTPGATIQVRIASQAGDTCFNATSLANAQSNGDSVSVAAEGGVDGINNGGTTGTSGGLASNSVGNHTKTDGQNGGNATGSATGKGGDSPNGGIGGASQSGGAKNGLPGVVPGGGGSGSIGNISNTAGVGANGRIRIRYEPLPAGQHRMFLVFSNVAAALLSGWTAVLGALATLAARQPRAVHQPEA